MANLISYRESYFPHDLTWQPLSDNETFQSLKAPIFECATFERSTIIDWDEVLNTEGTVLSPDADDANKAGTAQSHKCILILTEGDSAKALAMSGISSIKKEEIFMVLCL